ncbi:MAG: tetratricopeptide repeat protein, partial [Phormidesmis sp.]
YFGYDEKAHTLQQILQAIGKRVLGEFEFASFGAMGLGAQRRKLAEVLRAERYAIVLDNLESVTGEALAIQNTLSEAEREEIKRFLLALVGGQTKVVLGSRSNEAWLQDVFTQAGGKVNRYRLRGLDGEARTMLAEKILAATALSQQEIESIRQDKDFGRLMDLLAGYPLAMEVVLANLVRQSAAAVLAGLDAADVNLDSKTEDRTKSILKCVEYSHSNLSAAAQKLLLCLAPFKGFIDRADLANYAKQLQQLAPFAEWEFDQFEAAVDEALRWGLLSPYFDGDDGRLLRIQPVFPYFLKAKLTDVDEAVTAGLATGFKNHYRGLAAQYKQMMQSKEPEQRKLGLFFCGLEYENLFSALQTSLQRKENPTIFWCLQTYLGLSKDRNGELAILEFVSQSLEEYGSDVEPEMQEQIIRVSGQKANLYLELQRYSEARESYQALIALIENSKVDAQSILATIYHQLGSVAEELREYEQARGHYQQALDIYIEYGDRYSQASTYHQLGIVAQALREYEQARGHYQQALDIKIEYGDRYSQAGTYHQLGRVAQALREYEQARGHYQQALDIKIELGARYSQAGTYGQLGLLAAAQENYGEAGRQLLKALETVRNSTTITAYK